MAGNHDCSSSTLVGVRSLSCARYETGIRLLSLQVAPLTADRTASRTAFGDVGAVDGQPSDPLGDRSRVVEIVGAKRREQRLGLRPRVAIGAVWHRRRHAPGARRLTRVAPASAASASTSVISSLTNWRAGVDQAAQRSSSCALRLAADRDRGPPGRSTEMPPRRSCGRSRETSEAGTDDHDVDIERIGLHPLSPASPPAMPGSSPPRRWMDLQHERRRRRRRSA